MQCSGAEILVRTLLSHGADTVFGYPGGTVLNIFDELYKNSDKLNFYLTCHEQGAAHAADGYARATGRTGVVIATSGPGATNLVTGIATAYLDSTPMVAITGNVASGMIGKDSFQEVDIMGITMPVTKHNYVVKDITKLEHVICEAFQIANSGRPGPVLIDIPKDIQLATCEFKGGLPLPKKQYRLAQESELDKAVEIINESKRPSIYVGGGVILANAVEELRAFVNVMDAPIGASMMGLSAIGGMGKMCLGMTGMHGNYLASMAMSEADLIIGIGVRFSDRATGNKTEFQRKAKILHIDIDDAEIDKNVTAYASILGNIKEVLPRLTAKLTQKDNSKWFEELTSKCGNTAYYSNGHKLSPRDIIAAVNKYKSDDTVVATDMGQHQLWTAQQCAFNKPRTFITSGGLGTMGFGMGAAMGASIGKHHAKTVLVTGDGSFHMNFNEVVSAVSHNLPLVILVINNGVLGMVRQWQNLFFDKRFSQTTHNRKTDYVLLAQALGAEGARVTDRAELDEVMKKAFELKDRPIVIDCVIDKDEMVLPMIPPNGSIKNIILR